MSRVWQALDLGLTTMSEQREVVRQMTSARDIEVLAGLAGTGKSAAVAAAKDVWDVSGYRVSGAALSGIAAENLEKSSGVECRTLASWELSWKNGRDGVSSRDVFVIDEAGMVGSRQMVQALTKLHEAGAKAVFDRGRCAVAAHRGGRGLSGNR